jgi:hypothetical protein
MAIMEPGKRVQRARYDSCWMRARRSRGSLGISTLLEARWQRNEGAQTGPKPGLPGRLAPQKLAPGLSTSYDRYG